MNEAGRILFFRKRAIDLREHMDDPNGDRERLFRTYRQFDLINRLLCRWPRVFAEFMLPYCDDPEREYTLLDIGAGGGHAAKQVLRIARRKGVRIRAVAIDPDPRAAEYVAEREAVEGLEFRAAFSRELVAEGARFDFVIGNHLLHHLTEPEIAELLEDAEALAEYSVAFNDLSRSIFAWLGFAVFGRLVFHRSFVVTDGLRSIRRSFRARELEALAPPGWKVQRLVPNRLILSRCVELHEVG
jgi:2-polyprenyl-3-methyl-5-hydroxy-6-metoxy-1,4-benzoquinol methylase